MRGRKLHKPSTAEYFEIRASNKQFRTDDIVASLLIYNWSQSVVCTCISSGIHFNILHLSPTFTFLWRLSSKYSICISHFTFGFYMHRSSLYLMMNKNQSESRDRMELQVAEIASSAACRGAERALPFMEQRDFSICAGRSQCRTEGQFILNQGCPKRFWQRAIALIVSYFTSVQNVFDKGP